MRALGLLVLAGIGLTAGCASLPAAKGEAAAPSPSTAASRVDISGRAAVTRLPMSSAAAPSPAAEWDIPWADLPGAHLEQPALAAAELTSHAPACTASQLTPTNIRGPGVSGDRGQIVDLRNSSSTVCLLTGQVHATLKGAGVSPASLASPVDFWRGQTSYDMKPGEATSVWFEVSDCRDSTSPTPVFSMADITIPGGGVVVVPGLDLFDFCDSVGPFYRYHPDPTYPAAPLAGATVSIEAPARVRAGSSFDYVVAIHNPTSTAITMVPCPSFQQFLSSFPDKTFHGLNCAGHDSLRAGMTLRFQMRLTVPATESSGPEKLFWLAGTAIGQPPAIVTVVGSSVSVPLAPAPSRS